MKETQQAVSRHCKISNLEMDLNPKKSSGLVMLEKYVVAPIAVQLLKVIINIQMVAVDIQVVVQAGLFCCELI